MDAVPKCARCGRVIEADLAASVRMYEGMHWLCFHLEYEHDTDPDIACGDIWGCPWWTIRYYEDKLRALGVNPADVRQEGLQRNVR